MSTPLDQPALLRDTVALRFVIAALVKALSDAGSVKSADVVAQIDKIISNFTDEQEKEFNIRETLTLIRSNIEGIE